MFARILAAFLMAAGMLCPLASCDYRVTGYPDQPPTMVTCTLTNADVRVIWIKDVDEAARACHDGTTDYGCAVPRGLNSEGTPIWVLYVPQPKHFNDVPVLATLGHELCHGLGGVHERAP